MDKKYRLYPGQVFTAKHYDNYTESFKTHMFVCVYVSCLNEKDKRDSDVEGLLITSKNSNEYLVPLKKSEELFLEKDSFVDTAASIRFRKSEIGDAIGSISSRRFTEVISMRSEIASRELNQCLQSLNNMSKFEAKYKEKN